VFGPWCLIGGLAVNHYVEPVYTIDADIVVVASGLPDLVEHLQEAGLNPPTSDLRIQFTTDPRYQAFLPRACEATVLGVAAKVAALEDIAQGKLWAWSDPSRRLSKRKKDELDLIRLAEAHPHLLRLYPEELRRLFWHT
jgi:hypothetical protein